MTTDPRNCIPIDFDINNPPKSPKIYDKKFLKRTDKAAEKIKKTNDRRRMEYSKWLETAKWYLANQALQFNRVPTSILERYSKIAKDFDKTVSLLSAFNRLKKYTKSRRRKKCLHQI